MAIATVQAAKPTLRRATALNRRSAGIRVNGHNGHANGANGSIAKLNGNASKINGSATTDGIRSVPTTNGRATGNHGAGGNGKAKNGTALSNQKVNGSNGTEHHALRVNGNGKASLAVEKNGKKQNGKKQSIKLPRANVKARATPKTVRGSKPSGRKPSGSKPRSIVAQDRLLVDRCLRGEPAAWSQMYDRFHGSLLASIRAFLGRAGHDSHLIDEISARVWYSVVRNDFELLAKFDPARGCRLSTFLSVLGKSEARLLLRSERRRKTRECVASRPEIELPDATGVGLADDDFLATLSPRERAFYLDILVAAEQGNGDADYSRQNQWQLRHRVRKKLEQFLE